MVKGRVECRIRHRAATRDGPCMWIRVAVMALEEGCNVQTRTFPGISRMIPLRGHHHYPLSIFRSPFAKHPLQPLVVVADGDGGADAGTRLFGEIQIFHDLFQLGMEILLILGGVVEARTDDEMEMRGITARARLLVVVTHLEIQVTAGIIRLMDLFHGLQEDMPHEHPEMMVLFRLYEHRREIPCGDVDRRQPFLPVLTEHIHPLGGTLMVQEKLPGIDIDITVVQGEDLVGVLEREDELELPAPLSEPVDLLHGMDDRLPRSPRAVVELQTLQIEVFQSRDDEVDTAVMGTDAQVDGQHDILAVDLGIALTEGDPHAVMVVQLPVEGLPGGMTEDDEDAPLYGGEGLQTVYEGPWHEDGVGDEGRNAFVGFRRLFLVMGEEKEEGDAGRITTIQGSVTGDDAALGTGLAQFTVLDESCGVMGDGTVEELTDPCQQVLLEYPVAVGVSEITIHPGDVDNFRPKGDCPWQADAAA